MQSESIHNPTRTENAQSQTSFPTSGDNFTTAACLDGVTDPMALLEAIDFVNDCLVVLAAFEAEKDRTGTP